LKWVHR